MRLLIASVGPVIRLAKALLTLLTGLYVFLIVFGNLTDYWTNFKFVQHVLSMDTIFPDSRIKYRAIKSPRVHHIAYISIIIWETLIGALLTKGGLDMFRNLQSDPESFHQSKRAGIGGMFAALLLWFVGFQGVASDWFGMWMSKEWNGLPDAARLTQYISALLIFVSLKNDD